MSGKLYTKTFVKESKLLIGTLDDHMSFVEQSLDGLETIFQKYTSGKQSELQDESKTETSDYQNDIHKMIDAVSDIYTLKNELISQLEKLTVLDADSLLEQ